MKLNKVSFKLKDTIGTHVTTQNNYQHKTLLGDE